MYTFSGKCFRDGNLDVPDYCRYNAKDALAFAKRVANDYGVTCDIRYKGYLVYKVRTGDNPTQARDERGNWITL